MRTAKTLIRLGGCRGWSESSLGAHSLCWFCDEAAHIVVSFHVTAKIWKLQTSEKNAVIVLNLIWFYQTVMCQEDEEGIANSVDPDQTAPKGAIWSGSTLFAQPCLSESAQKLLSHIMRNLFMPNANKKGADQPAHSHSLISALAVCSQDRIIPILPKTKISRL